MRTRELNQLLKLHQLWLESHQKEGARLTISYAAFKKVGFGYLELEKASFFDCTFEECEFYGTRLKEARFINGRILKSSFHSAYLQDAIFQRVEMPDTAMRYSYATGLIMASSYIDKVDFTGAESVVDLGIDSRGYRFIAFDHRDHWMIKAGCRWFTLEAAQKHWGRNGNLDALARLDILNTHELSSR